MKIFFNICKFVQRILTIKDESGFILNINNIVKEKISQIPEPKSLFKS